MTQVVTQAAHGFHKTSSGHLLSDVNAVKPVKVLLVMPLAEQRGGGELMLLHLLEYGRFLGVDWSIAFFSDGPMADAARGWNVPTYIVPTGRLRHPHRMIRAVYRLRQLIQEQNIDLVFSWMGKAQLYGGAAAALAGVPAIWYQLGLPDPPCWQDRIATWIPSRAVLTCSKSATTAQEKLKPHRTTITVNPGVDLSKFDPAILPSPADCRRKLGLPLTGPLIGIVGRLQRWKGMHHLIEAMPAVLMQHPNAHLVVVGGQHSFEPQYPEFLRERIASLHLDDKVILAGLQTNVPEWMQAMDVIVHASNAEPFGIVVIEGMALRKPVIATSTAGPTEIITDGIDGFLWSPGDVMALTNCILDLLDDPQLSRKVAMQAAVRARDFDVRRYAEGVSRALKPNIAVHPHFSR